MSTNTTFRQAATSYGTADASGADPADLDDLDGLDDPDDGWQVLAAASLGRLLTDAEMDEVRRMPAKQALDLLFPHLTDAARHEALWALG